ncbi:MAG: hypothetical protein AAF721_32135, partial [Myxococcota bacterium]
MVQPLPRSRRFAASLTTLLALVAACSDTELDVELRVDDGSTFDAAIALPATDDGRYGFIPIHAGHSRFHVTLHEGHGLPRSELEGARLAFVTADADYEVTDPPRVVDDRTVVFPIVPEALPSADHGVFELRMASQTIPSNASVYFAAPGDFDLDFDVDADDLLLAQSSGTYDTAE